MIASAGFRFRAALAQERPLQVAGCINAYSACLAESVGFRAIYLSGAGVANDARTAVTTLDVVAMKVVPTLRSAAIGSVAAGAVGWVTAVTAAIRTESRCAAV